MFVNFDQDIRDKIMSEHIIYMSSYYGRNSLFPNSGVIVVAKRDENTDEILQLVWNHKKKSGDVWWDQQEFLKSLGFNNRNTKIISYLNCL